MGTHRDPGGAASHFTSLVLAMLDAGHEVAVVASPEGVIWPALERDGRVALTAAEFTQKITPSAMRAVRRAAQSVRPDWIVGAFEIDYWGLALVAVERRVPLALFLHHAGLKRSTMRGMPWLVRQWIFPSHYLGAWAERRGISAGKIAVLYNPIDTDHFRPSAERRAAARTALGIGPDELLVGYVGRLETNKGVDVFARAVTAAMDRVPSLRALWVGFGTLEAELDRIIRESPHGDRHLRRGWADDVAEYYAAMDILALPSTGPEAFGRVLVEAQASGVPVLGSAVGGIAETMDADVTGRLVEGGEREWTDALLALVTDGAARARMAAAGPAFVRARFDGADVAAELARLLGG